LFFRTRFLKFSSFDCRRFPFWESISKCEGLKEKSSLFARQMSSIHLPLKMKVILCNNRSENGNGIVLPCANDYGLMSLGADWSKIKNRASRRAMKINMVSKITTALFSVRDVFTNLCERQEQPPVQMLIKCSSFKVGQLILSELSLKILQVLLKGTSEKSVDFGELIEALQSNELPRSQASIKLRSFLSNKLIGTDVPIYDAQCNRNRSGQDNLADRRSYEDMQIAVNCRSPGRLELRLYLMTIKRAGCCRCQPSL